LLSIRCSPPRYYSAGSPLGIAAALSPTLSYTSCLCIYTSCPVQTARLLSVFWGCCISCADCASAQCVCSGDAASGTSPRTACFSCSCCGRGGSSGNPFGRLEANPRRILLLRLSRTTPFPSEPHSLLLRRGRSRALADSRQLAV